MFCLFLDFFVTVMQGRLTQLAAASVGMACPNGLPANLSGLSALQTLDFAFNSLNSTTERLTQVIMLCCIHRCIHDC
jgi:hypothetical protein